MLEFFAKKKIIFVKYLTRNMFLINENNKKKKILYKFLIAKNVNKQVWQLKTEKNKIFTSIHYIYYTYT